MGFSKSKQSKRDVAIGLDLGTSQVKAVVLRAVGNTLQIAEFAVMPFTAVVGKAGDEQKFAEELQQVMGKLSVADRNVSVTISCPSAIICMADIPRMPVVEARSAFRMQVNSMRYLRRDLSNYHLDVAELENSPAGEKAKKSATMRILVGAAGREEVRWYRAALLAAKIRPDVMELASVSITNAFQLTHKELCEKENILLVDVGSRTTAINFLRYGQPWLTRIMHFGGAQISEYLAQVLSLDAVAAEEEKVKMSETVQPLVRAAMQPLAKEVRASVDFFERQQECQVGHAFACGGSACGRGVLDSLGVDVGMKIEKWDPIQGFDTSPLSAQAAQLEKVGPSLAAAIGAAAVRLE